MRKLEEKESAQAQDEYTPPGQSVLFPLPEIPSTLSAGPNHGSSDIFKNFRRLGLSYLDENGEQVEFSAGAITDDDEGHQTRSKDTETVTSESSDSESEQFEWDMEDSVPGDYWPYPSKTVGDEL